VRNKEGQALRNSHVVGFFRRICKLLFFGIKPVFVFDGGAPALKRQTLANRAQRREGRKEDATRTAGKMLALQMRRRAIIETEREKMGMADTGGDELGDNVVYYGELDLKPEERNRKFRKTDQYHLPNLEFPLEYDL
jgi:DNA excision repair protein ERCC-5